MSGYVGTLMWAFLPSKISQMLLPPLSGALPMLLPPAPPGSEAWRNNYRRVLTVVVILALAYNFATQARGGQDWYDLLGVSPRAGDDELKRAFRQLSRVYHPDRLGPNAGPAAEARFIAIRLAYETLTDPVKRFAYDRFGPESASWQKVEDTRAFVSRGAQSSAGFYIGTVGFMLVLALLGRAQQGAYWRNVLLGILLIWEATLVLSPTPERGQPLTSEPVLLPLPKPLASVLAFIIPTSMLQRPAYRHIALLHRLFTDSSIAISQLAAEWSSTQDTGQVQQSIVQLASVVNDEANGALWDEIGPVLAGTNDKAGAERNLLERMENVFLQRSFTSHPATGQAFNAAMERELGPKHAHLAPPANAAYNGVAAVDAAAAITAATAAAGSFNMDADGSAVKRTTRGTTPRNSRRRTPGPADTLAAAATTPLPPSRPDTPADPPAATEGQRRRSARLGSVQ